MNRLFAMIADALFCRSYGPQALAEKKAWERMQEHFKALEKSSSTQVVGKARRDRTELVHSALGLKASRSIPSRDVVA